MMTELGPVMWSFFLRRMVGGSRGSTRGFTLVELMAVVLIMGVLAVVGTSMFRKHIISSRTIETTSMIRSIAAAQERFRGESMSYLDVSTNLETFYPGQADELGQKKFDWDRATHPDYANWQLLQPTVTGPVQYGYACASGPPGPDQDIPVELMVDPGWPGEFQTPWYVIQAMGDLDGDGEPSYFVGSSFNSQIFQGGSPE